MAGQGQVAALYVPGTSVLHRLPPQVKIAAATAFVLAVVLTPPQAFWAFALYAVALVSLVLVARIPFPVMARRMLIEVPFVLFALLIPFLAGGSTVDVLGLELSEAGLMQAWNILAKATLGVAASALLASTTEAPDLVVGLQRLRVPRVFVSIVSFMVRYVDVIVDEAARMRVARESRGYEPSALWQAKALALSVGALFIRSYERGERVYLAMVSRGWDGELPDLGRATASPQQWVGALVLPVAATAVMLTAVVTHG